ncbi:hypothetical protein I2I11_18340 [Pontibacter sp. 172403-2]|uniref:DUF6089 family protein n=1 Tax=Pontibacter rufus TaxID=2791028 RepID=UPI0018AF807B|nr:DUF6089 family protein [Pontibacter sp. 172403-2]MBF9255263.1 hypothetical protein [Pontibacter sp. 172403-2]
MSRSFTLALLFFALAVFATEADAQRYIKEQRYGSVGVSVGAMNYFGDIVPEPDFTSLRFKSTRPTIGLSYAHRLGPHIAVRGAFNWGRIIGDDAVSASANEGENLGRYKRNLSFRNDIKELSAVAVFDLLENRRSYRLRPDFVPYAFLGVAVFHHNPKAYYENGSRPGLDPASDIPTGWYELQPLGTEGQFAGDAGTYPAPYKRLQIAIPFGLGARYKINTRLDISLEVSWRKTFTDYLDDVSTSYVDKALFLSDYAGVNDKASAILSDRSAESGFDTVEDPSGTVYDVVPGYGSSVNTSRGGDSSNDWYITTNLTLSYIVPPRIRSPKFR